MVEGRLRIGVGVRQSYFDLSSYCVTSWLMIFTETFAFGEPTDQKKTVPLQSTLYLQRMGQQTRVPPKDQLKMLVVLIDSD